MTPERWRFVRQLFDDALELPPKARPAFVEERCGDDAEARILVTSMLAEHGAGGGPMDHPLIHLGEGGMEAPEDGGGRDLPGRLGVYDCLRRIGRGGMGTVYLGVRADDAYRQEVAIKVLRKGLDTEDLVRRFRRERQILASLDHPNIAKLLDGGSTRDGRPYLVMEHVDGEPVDRYCDDRRLSVEDRLRLFGKVCAAVQSAHRKLVVHRDLKPANILVSVAGEPKLLDFGVAKLLDPEGFPESVAATREGPAPLTPEYASPEQLRGETISTASDVYSLGVVLHLLLCGRGPDFGAADPRDSAESEAARPSTLVRVSTSTFDPAAAAQARGLDPPRLARSLAGDLDNVVRRALHPEPDRRYPSVSDFAQDLEWHLTDRPVAARPDTLGYRAGKFLRRRTLAVATSTLAALFLVGWGVSLQIGRIELERQIRRAEAASGFLEDVFEVSDPTRALGESITAREVLDRGVEQIDAELGSQPDLRADLKEPMARSYKNLGLYDEAEALLRDVLDQRLRRHGENHPEVVAVLLELAEVEELRGELDSAEGLALKAQGTSRRLLGERSGPHVESLLRLAKIHTEQGRRADAAAELERAIDLAQDADLPELLASGVDDRAELLELEGDLEGAETWYQRALALRVDLHGELHPKTALVVNNLALAVKERDAVEAEALFRRAEATQRRLYPEGHPDLALTLGNLGLLFHELGRYDDADALYSEALALQRKAFRVEHPRLATAVNNLAGLRLDQGRIGEAETLYRKAVELRRRVLGDEHPDTAAAVNNLGQVLAGQGRWDEAEGLFREALAVSRAHYGTEHVQVAVVLVNLARGSAARGDLEDGERLLREALGILRRGLGDSHPRVAMALHNLARVQAEKGDLEGAEGSYRGALSILEVRLGERHRDVGRLKVSLAGLHHKAGNSTAATGLAREALDILEGTSPGDDPWVAAASRVLASRANERDGGT